MTDTTEPTVIGQLAATADSERPAILLAVCKNGPRPPSRRVIPPDGLVLGRNLSVFDGGPLNDGRMSRRHAEVRPGASQNTVVLCDLNSKNGTWVRSERVQEAALGPGDSFRLGDSLFVVATGIGSAHDPEFVGQSPKALHILESIHRIAQHSHAVLIEGETGTGKEVTAASIHRRSGRNGRFVVVNCAALSEGVLESELFGHVRGAFTGANESREGLFRAASGGTLLLDEVGEVPFALQAKLLRAVDTASVRPVGSVTEVGVDVRLIAATNMDLTSRVRQGKFRADLYARLSQYTMVMPPLRERREDVPLLVRHLLAVLGAESRAVEVDFAEALLGHPLPLNVRGLRNLVATALVACPEGGPLSMVPEVRMALANQAALVAPQEGGVEPFEPVAQFSRAEPPHGGVTFRANAAKRASMPDREALVSALKAAGGSVAETARTFGGSRQQVYRWARALGVDLQGSREGGG